MSRDGIALVTGGTGFIGRHLVDELARRGRRVRTCGRRARPGDLPAGVEYGQADLAGPAPLHGLLDGVTVLFHVAGAASSTADHQQMQATNVVGTERLLTAAQAAGVGRVVHVSTTSVYGKEVVLPAPVVETAPCHPGAGYAASKWEAEQVVARFVDDGLPVAVLRPSTVYGPGAVKLVASTILDAAIERYAGLRGFAVPVQPVELRLVHVDDVVAACLHLAEHDDAPGRTFNLTSGAYPSSHEVAGAVADGLDLELERNDDHWAGLDPKARGATRRRMLADGMVDAILFKSQRIRLLHKANPNNRLSLDALAATGFATQLTDVATGVADAIAWYRDHRWIL